jgi:hypothetical protein
MAIDHHAHWAFFAIETPPLLATIRKRSRHPYCTNGIEPVSILHYACEHGDIVQGK